MADHRKSPLEFLVEELDRELIARGAKTGGKKQFNFKDKEGTPARDVVISGIKESYKTAPPPNDSLTDISTWDLSRILIFKTRSEMDFTRGAWSDDLMDCFEISNKQINENVNCTAAVTLKDNLIDEKNGFSRLKVKNYGKTFNLCDVEPFRDQPISAGKMFTGFLVKDDMIATAAHTVNENNIKDFRFVFGYKMLDPFTPVIRFSNENIYRGVKIIKWVLHRRDYISDWTLVKLDRNVVGQTVARLSEKEISCDQAVYALGHPVGLPLKYVAGASVREVYGTYFGANLNIYSGNSGSPVFDLYTHEVIGMVVRGESSDFRWTGDCWISVIYPGGRSAACTRVSEFIDISKQL